MYHFAVIALLALALCKVVDLLEDVVPSLTRFHAMFTMALAVAGCVALDYSVFDGFGISLRDADYGTWATGLVVGGMTSAWRAAFHWVGSSEGDAREPRQHGRPRMAA